MSEIPPREEGAAGQATSDDAAIQNISGRGILCAKCEHLNPVGLEKCETCQAHLFVFCTYCGTRNGRVLTRCTKCRRRLKAGLGRKLRDTDRKPVNLIYIAIGLVVLVAAAAAVIKAAGARLW